MTKKSPYYRLVVRAFLWCEVIIKSRLLKANDYK